MLQSCCDVWCGCSLNMSPLFLNPSRNDFRSETTSLKFAVVEPHNVVVTSNIFGLIFG